MTDQVEQDDVHVYVSPRRFGGCTPGPKATKQKIFEEEQKKEHAKKREKISFDLEDVKYGNEFQDSKGDVHKKVGRNNVISQIVLFLNYLLMVLGVVLAAVSIWVALGERNGGITAYAFRRGFFIKSPLALGICLFLGAASAILLGFFYGVKQLVPSILQGMQESNKRIALCHYQIATSLGVLLFGAILFSVVGPLHHVKEHEITSTLWREMSIRSPEQICNYEVANGCAGSRNGMCRLPTAFRNSACPGHFCDSACSAASSRPKTNDPSCKYCIESFSSLPELRKCRESESGRGTSSTCISRLGSDVRKYFTIVIIAASVGLGAMLCLIVMGTIGPLLGMNA